MTPHAKPIRLGFLLSGGGRTLLNILDEVDAGRLSLEVVTVIGSRPCKGLDRAAARGLTTHLVNYKSMPDVETYSQKITELLDEANVDLVILAGFLSPYLVPDRYVGRVLNIHPALLPKFGGKGMYGHHVHQAVLEAGETESGCTVHFVTNEYDDGPIVLQRTVPVYDGDTPDDLADRVFEQECVAFPEAIRLFAEGAIAMQDGKLIRLD